MERCVGGELMLTVRGTYDGKRIRVLPSEPIPPVSEEVPVAIIFLEDFAATIHKRRYQTTIARRMRAARAVMEPLAMSVKDLVEEGRER
jgi:hypothetical protein